MNATQWQRSKNPQAMLDFLGRSATRRKLRLFGAACARLAFPWLSQYPCAEDLVRKVELLADGLTTPAELQKARRALPGGVPYVPVGLVWTARAKPRDGANSFAQDHSVGARARHADLLRELFGNPFRTPSLVPVWLTPKVTSLATLIYHQSRFGDMPALADALEEAGCDHSFILDHCREQETHALGCWVLDLVLGKS